MTSETRSFNQPTVTLNYSINYQYNLAGQLTDVTDPNNKTITYTHDSGGRLTAINGSSFAGVTSYLSGVQYRAWGAIKHANYGNGKTSDASYNNRLKAATFQVSGLISKTYEYYPDGTLKFSGDATDHHFDRLYRWDQAVRIKEAYSGAEARSETSTTNRPYKETFAFDAMGHLTQRTDSFWSAGATTTSDSYTNNRHNPVGQLWQYDADGNLLMMPGASYTYDAGGRIDTAWSDSSSTLGVDGDGQKVKSMEVVWDPVQETDVTTYTFCIYSSVLGKVLTEKVTNDDPNSPYAYFTSRTFVYGDSGPIAYQESNSSLSQWVWWEHRDPSNASYRTSTSSGQLGDQQELDPTGANRGISDATYQGIIDDGSLAPYPASNNPAQPGTTYSIDGVRVSLDDFIQNLQIIFRGDLGLNESFARQSANDANYGRRWVRRGGYADYYHYSTLEVSDDLIITNVETTRVYFGQWVSSALSLGGSLASLIDVAAQGQLTTTVKSETWNVSPDITAIRSNLAAMLNTGGCGTFIEDLLNRLASSTKNPRVPGSVLDLFDMVNAQNGFVRGGLATKNKVSATVKGQLQSRDAAIHLGAGFSFMVTTPQQKAQAVVVLDAFNVLHELVHLAGSNSYYTDRQVAVALSNMGFAGLPVRRKGENSRAFVGRNSNYFSDVLRTKCPPL